MSSCPVRKALLSSCRRLPMASFMESVHLTLGLALDFPSSIVFSEEPCLVMTSPVLGSFSLSFLFPVMVQAHCALGPTCSFSWSRVTAEPWSLQNSFALQGPRRPQASFAAG